MRLPTSCYRLPIPAGHGFRPRRQPRALSRRSRASKPPSTPRRSSPRSSGSTHGYDVTDPGEESTRRWAARGGPRPPLQGPQAARPRPLILDIVPNHMAFSVETPWLRDILRHGTQSRHAGHFDLDPAAGRIRLALAHRTLRGSVCPIFRSPDDPEGPGPRQRRPPRALSRHALPRRRPLGRSGGPPPAPMPNSPGGSSTGAPKATPISHRRFFQRHRPDRRPRRTGRSVFEDVHALLFELVDTGIVDERAHRPCRRPAGPRRLSRPAPRPPSGYADLG